MKETIKYIGMMLVPLLLLATASCRNDDVIEESGLTEIYSIKILNGGASGTETLIGTVNENEKKISFPEIDPATNLSKLRFETELPEGASMDSLEYNFTVPAGNTDYTRVITVWNGKRYRSYFATIRLDLPVWGADFSEEKRTVYDFSGRTTIYPPLAGAFTRCVDMDIDHVLIVSRTSDAQPLTPHLLKMEDIKKGDVSKPIILNLTGVSGGTYPYSAGRLAHGHIYICNLATPSATSALKIYHWASPTATPELVGSFFSSDLAGYVTGRFGDYMSLDLDAAGNGYAFFGVNPNPPAASYKMLRLKVAGFTSVTEPTLINVATYGGLWGSCNQVDGSPGDYIYTGHQGPVMLVNSSGQIQYSVPAANIPNTGSDAHVISFNRERYIATMATPGAGSVDVYDLTGGESTTNALGLFVDQNRKALTQYSLGGAIASATAAGSIAWAKDGDEALYILGAGPGAGFVVIEFPKKVKVKVTP